MTLQLKHLGRRLHAGLCAQWVKKSDNVFEPKQAIRTVGLVDRPVEGIISVAAVLDNKCNWVPILRPLSDLTKSIKHKGDEFVPIERLWNMSNGEINVAENWPSNLNLLPVYVKDFLIEHNFHLGEPKGSWVDVNSLKVNPYE